MNDLRQNSQGPSVPKTKFDQLRDLISVSDLTMLGSVVYVNLLEASTVMDEIDDGQKASQITDALFDLTLGHIYAIEALVQQAATIHNFIDFNLSLKLAGDLKLVILNTKTCTLNDNLKADFLYGLAISAKRFCDQLCSLHDVISNNKEILNG